MPRPETSAAGQLRERVAFERRDIVDDGFGNEVAGDWIAAFAPTLFAARIKPARGGETIQASRLGGKQPVVITVRSSTQTRQVQTEWRVRDVRHDVTYNIRSIVNPDEKNAFLDMECDTGGAD